MAQCVTVGDGGVLQVSAADPCTTLVVVTPAEYAAQQSIFVPLSIDNGFDLGVAILGAWTVGFVFRILRKQIEDFNVTGE